MVLDELRRGADGDQGAEWSVGIDSSVSRAHQHAAGARHQPPTDLALEVSHTAKAHTGGWVE